MKLPKNKQIGKYKPSLVRAIADFNSRSSHSSFLYGIDQLSVKMLFSSFIKQSTGKNSGLSLIDLKLNFYLYHLFIKDFKIPFLIENLHFPCFYLCYLDYQVRYP